MDERGRYLDQGKFKAGETLRTSNLQAQIASRHEVSARRPSMPPKIPYRINT